MPYCWDGLDNAQRVQDTGYGRKLARYTWTDAEMSEAIESLLHDQGMAERLQALSRHMQRADGRQKAAQLILEVAERGV
jgi:UDP:flavonoid glycosyltransferase YjiC (YdhE family)